MYNIQTQIMSKICLVCCCVLVMVYLYYCQESSSSKKWDVNLGRLLLAAKQKVCSLYYVHTYFRISAHVHCMYVALKMGMVTLTFTT